jgi:hypothetical protein
MYNISGEEYNGKISKETAELDFRVKDDGDHLFPDRGCSGNNSHDCHHSRWYFSTGSRRSSVFKLLASSFHSRYPVCS